MDLSLSVERLRRHLSGVRGHLAILAIITTLPLALFSVMIVGQLREGEIEALHRRAAQEAESLAQMCDRQFHDMLTTVSLLETSPELVVRDLERFDARAKAALGRSGWYILIVDETGQQLVNTRIPFGQPLPKTGNMESLRQGLASNEAVISNVFLGRTSGQFVYNVLKSLAPGPDGKRLSLILTQNAADMQNLFGHRPLPPGWNYALLDGIGHVAASSAAMAPGEAFPPSRLERARQTATADVGGSRTELLGYAKVGRSDWQVVVWGPDDGTVGTVKSTWLQLIFAGCAFLLLSLVSAMLFGRKLRSAIKGLADQAQGVGRGDIVSPLHSGVREIDQVSRALSEASFDRDQAEERLQVTLREMAHRTKNVILVAQSLVRQTSRHSTDKDAFVAAISGRMQAFALSLDLMMSDQTADPSFRQLVSTQLNSFIDSDARLTIEGEDFMVVSWAVKEIGMLLHELATNAMKYGALSVPEGRLTLRWHRFEQDGAARIALAWTEEGGPLPVENGRKGFGSVLIQSMAQSLKGTARSEYRSTGVVWTLEFPASAISVADTNLPH